MTMLMVHWLLLRRTSQGTEVVGRAEQAALVEQVEHRRASVVVEAAAVRHHPGQGAGVEEEVVDSWLLD